MKKILVIGIGAGDPEYVTVQAIRALNQADVFFFMDKGDDTEDLVRLRRDICDRYIQGTAYRVVVTEDPRRGKGGAYEQDVAAWHAARTDIYEQLIRTELDDEGCGAFLVWGDPSLYDSTLRFVAQIKARGNVDFDVEVIPGISSVQALAARHAVPLHGVGQPVTITTGRRLAEGWPPGVDNLVVMLDGRAAFEDVEADGVTIYWGAYIGTDDELLVSGPLAERAGEISEARTEARATKGWLFDTYLLRREPGRAGVSGPPAIPPLRGARL